MAYKILYIEDKRGASLIHDLEQAGFEAELYNPTSLEETIHKVKSGFDLVIVDFRLTGKVVFDAPTIASTLRTFKSDSHLGIPLVLISAEEKMSDYYKDLTSHDLFDLSILKSTLLESIPKYKNRFEGLIKAYQSVKTSKFDSSATLGISEEFRQEIDYRILKELNSDARKGDVFATVNFVHRSLIRSIGVLIGEDVLAARLGIKKGGKDWGRLLQKLETTKYNGALSNTYNRWWAEKVEKWWETSFPESTRLRRLKAEERLGLLNKKFDLKLEVAGLAKYAKSTSFWTICLDSHKPIDPVDGLEIERRRLEPWHDKEYISMESAVTPVRISKSTGESYYRNCLKPQEKAHYQEFLKTI